MAGPLWVVSGHSEAENFHMAVFGVPESQLSVRFRPKADIEKQPRRDGGCCSRNYPARRRRPDECLRGPLPAFGAPGLNDLREPLARPADHFERPNRTGSALMRGSGS